MKWYKLEAQIRGVTSTAYAYTGPMRLRALVVLALARRDAAANLLRSRDDFYAELKRLSGACVKVTIHRDGGNPILVIKALREIAFGKLAKLSTSLIDNKRIVDQVRDGKPYSFAVKSQHRDEIIAKLRAAGAVVG